MEQVTDMSPLVLPLRDTLTPVTLKFLAIEITITILLSSDKKSLLCPLRGSYRLDDPRDHGTVSEPEPEPYRFVNPRNNPRNCQFRLQRQTIDITSPRVEVIHSLSGPLVNCIMNIMSPVSG